MVMRSFEGRATVVASYEKEMRRHPILTPEEEVALAASARAGDADARERFLKAHMRLAMKIAREWRRHGIPLHDLIHESVVAMMESFKRFDHAAGIPFHMYAPEHMRHHLWRVLDKRHLLTHAEYLYRDLYRLKKAMTDAWKEGRRAEDAELIDKLGVSAKVLERLKAMSYRTRMRSLHEVVRGQSYDKPANELWEMISDQAPRQDHALAGLEFRARVRAALDGAEKTLNAKECFVLRHRLMAEEPMEIKEIGRRLGISHQRVSQIVGEIKEKLRPFLAPFAEEAA